MWGVLFGQVRPSLPSFIVALGGVGLAYLWLEIDWRLSAGIAGALLIVGAIAYWRGDANLNRDRPRATAARRWLECTVLAPIALGSFVGAGLIVLGIATVPGEDWSEEQKQLSAAIATAITTYFTTVFVKGAEDADTGWVGTIVKGRFQTRLEGRFPDQTDARNAVFDLTRGWDADARKERAREIDEYIAADGEVRPRT